MWNIHNIIWSMTKTCFIWGLSYLFSIFLFFLFLFCIWSWSLNSGPSICCLKCQQVLWSQSARCLFLFIRKVVMSCRWLKGLLSTQCLRPSSAFVSIENFNPFEEMFFYLLALCSPHLAVLVAASYSQFLFIHSHQMWSMNFISNIFTSWYQTSSSPSLIFKILISRFSNLNFLTWPALLIFLHGNSILEII